jgi:hypothetical protein
VDDTMNRVGLGLAIGAGYVLGRTRKLKLAVAVGGLVAGKRLNLTPRAVTGLVAEQLRNNPQFKEIGDQLRQDLRGMGKAASGVMVERQLDGLADRLHGRTAQVREQLTGGPARRDRDDDADDGPEDAYGAGDGVDDESGEEDEPRPRRSAGRAAKKAPAQRAAKTAKAAKKAPARKTAAARGSRARLPKGGDDA